MKKIPKKQLDEIIELTRKYWESGEKELIQKRMDHALCLEKEIGVHWLSILNFVSGILANHGFCSEAENWRVYAVLNVLGWEVVDEEQTSESL